MSVFAWGSSIELDYVHALQRSVFGFFSGLATPRNPWRTDEQTTRTKILYSWKDNISYYLKLEMLY